MTYTATSWVPLEGSIVPVPADDSVGANRSADTPAPEDQAVPTPTPAKTEERNMADEVNTTAPVAGARAASGEQGLPRDLETKLIASVAETCEMQRELPRWISSGMSLEEVRKDIEAASIRKAQAPTPAGAIDLTPKEEASYNVSRAIMAIADGSWNSRGGLEKEVSDAIAKRSGKPSRGLYIPLTLNTRASITGNIVGTSSLGGAAVQTTLQSLIEILRNRLVARQAGCRFLTGLTDTISFPRQIVANTFNWTGENPTAANTLGSLTLNNLSMSPKTGMVSTAFSRQVLLQSSPDMQAMVLDDIASVIALGVDSAAFNGTGTLQPTGVRLTSSIGNRTLGAAGAALAWADLVGLETDVAGGNADLGSLAYVTNATVRGKLKTTLKSTTAGSSYLWEGGNDPGTINGYRAFASNQIPSNLTQGTSTTICSSIIFGNWAECLVGVWGDAVDLIIDPYTNAGQNMINVTGITMVDVGVRHAASFSKSDAVLTS
jgi:HK97 family phage major capsid protein